MDSDFKTLEFLALIKDIPNLNAEYAVEAVGDPALYKTILQKCCRFLPGYISGMDNAVLAGDWGAFAIKIHGIKGSLRQIGHTQLSVTAEALEKAAKSDDPAYCLAHYEDFKAGLIGFFDKIGAVFQNVGEYPQEVTHEKRSGNIAGYLDRFISVKAALEDYDSTLAAELLQPLTEINFGDLADELITGAAHALELFQPLKALEYIDEILELFS